MFDHRHPLPKYYQLMELIRAKIADGAWQPGDLIPSERELCEQYGISRMTARHALNALTHEGLLRREQGRGTFVATPKLEQRLTRLTGFTEDMRQRGLRSQTLIVQLRSIPAPVAAAKALGIPGDTAIVLLERLRKAEEEPIALETCHLHFDGVEELLREDFENGSLYRVLAEKYGLVPSRAEQQVEADLCNQREQRLLALPAGAPILRNRRTTFDQHGRAFEYTESAYRGDRYVFYVELTTTKE